MLGFMDYVQSAWYAATGWDPDNSYGALTQTARSLLDFDTPVGVALHCSSLASRSFANSYTLSNAGAVDGSLSYLYSSRPLLLTRPDPATSREIGLSGSGPGPGSGLGAGAVAGAGAGAVADASSSTLLPSRSNEVPLRQVIQGYRDLGDDIHVPEPESAWEMWQGGRRVDVRDALLYGRLYLPQARLEALYLRRLSPASQLKIACASSSQLRNGGSILLLLQRDMGKASTEYLYSTDGGLLGFRGMYNFGQSERVEETQKQREEGVGSGGDGDSGELPVFGYSDSTAVPSAAASSSTSSASLSPLDAVLPRQNPLPNGRFSAGGELYYGALNKTGGMSLGCRFATLPRHPGFPYTMTLTLNPLMGNLSSTYAVRAGPSLALATRFDFNVYSYESEYQVGFELWKRKREAHENSLGIDAPDAVRWAVDKMRESERRGWKPERALQAAGQLTGGLEPEDGVSTTTFGNDSGLSAMTETTPTEAVAMFGTDLAVGPLTDEDTAGVLKARINQRGVIGILWEGRLKQLLCTFGLHVDFRQREQIFRGVGVEFHYSS